jgi:hypothetical protein
MMLLRLLRDIFWIVFITAVGFPLTVSIGFALGAVVGFIIGWWAQKDESDHLLNNKGKDK